MPQFEVRVSHVLIEGPDRDRSRPADVALFKPIMTEGTENIQSLCLVRACSMSHNNTHEFEYRKWEFQHSLCLGFRTQPPNTCAFFLGGQDQDPYEAQENAS